MVQIEVEELYLYGLWNNDKLLKVAATVMLAPTKVLYQKYKKEVNTFYIVEGLSRVLPRSSHIKVVGRWSRLWLSRRPTDGPDLG